MQTLKKYYNLKKIFIFLPFFSLPFFLKGQDAANNPKSSMTAAHSSVSPKTHQDILNDSLKLLLSSARNDSVRFEILGLLAYSYAWSNPDSSIVYAQEQLLLAKQLSSVRLEGRALWSNGVVASTMGNYSQALDFFLQNLIIAEKLNDSMELYRSNLGLCVTYRDQGNYDKAIYYAYKCKAASESLSDGNKSVIRIHIASIYEKFNQLDSALLYADYAYAIEKTLGSRNIWGALAYISGNIYSKKKQYALALKYYRGGVQIAINWNVQKDLVEIYNGMAKTFLASGQIDSGILYAKQAILVGSSTQYLNGVIIAGNLLSDIYQSQHNNDSALKYTKQTAAAKDNMFNREKINQVQNISFKERLRNQEIAVENIQYRNKVKIIVLAIVLVCVIAFMILYFRNRQLLQVLNIRNDIAGDLHDEIGATLSSVNMLSAVALIKAGDNNEAAPIIQQIKNSVQQAGESIDDIVWSVNPANDPAEDTFARIRKYVTELTEAKGVNCIIEIDDPGASLNLPMELRRDIYMVCKEAVNNVLKYSGCVTINVTIRLKNHHLIMTVADDGIGFDTDILKTSLRNGIGNMRYRIERHKGIFELASTKGKGTIIVCKVQL
ncbi:MAG: ATP-binding protein [Ginsengibacter sp.]